MTEEKTEHRVTYDSIRTDPEVREMIAAADQQMKAIGYTEHGMRHATIIAENAGLILRELDYDERQVELAKIGGLLHDIGNLVSRRDHATTSALLAYDLLRKRGMPIREVTQVVAAVGTHDEDTSYEPTSEFGAAVVIGDKADVARERVRNPHMAAFDIHDRINYAVRDTRLEVSAETKTISLDLTIDTEIGSVMEYFEIFLSRMVISRRAARMLGCDFRLIINGVPLL
ncbi:MAG: HD domain-containing protein [Armatimonadota bacterium]|jgi:metal-dependent HD superfamily phosphatase/phosphodiesterase